MEIVITLLCIASVILWIRHLVVSDRVNGLRYRVQKLEKQLQEIKGQTTVQAAAPQPCTQAAAAQNTTPEPVQQAAPTPEPNITVKEAIPVDKKPAIVEEKQPAQPLENNINTDKQPVYAATAANTVTAPTMDFSPAKLFSWIGGFMLFLGCVFGIKYAVENSLLSPSMRIICNTGLGILLAWIGYSIKQEKYRVTAHTLLGSGLAVIYASIYCAHAFYQFIPPATTFILLALTAFATFGAAVGKNAKYVGYLGAVIAFLTPLLIHSQKDAWAALFTYILFINAAAALAAAKRSWNGLLVFTLAFTWLSQAAWLFNGCSVEPSKLNGVCIFFSLYALGAAWLAHKQLFNKTANTALGVFLCAGMVLMLPLAAFSQTVAESVKLLGYTLFVNLLILWQTGRNNLPAWFTHIGKIMAFLVLFVWSNAYFDKVPPVLLFGAFIVFAAVNGGAELVWHKKEEKTAARPGSFSALYPAFLMLPLISALIIKPELPFELTIMALGLFFILMSGAVVLALLTGTVAAAAVGMGLTVFVLLSLTDRIAAWNAAQTLWLIWLGFIPALLGGGLFMLAKKIKKASLPGEGLVSSLTALSPFILLLAVIMQNPASKILCPHWILGATLALCALNVLAARIYKNTSFLPATLAGAVLVQIAYRYNNTFSPELAAALSGWSVGIFALFFVFPFVFKKYFWQSKSTWAAASLAGVAQCTLIYAWLKPLTKCFHWGLLPLAFLILYLPVVKKLCNDRQTDKRLTIPLAFAAGAVLFFLTVIFPLEMGGKWLTLAWSLEGCALVWLNKHVDYKGLTRTGYGLLAITFLRLLWIDFAPIPSTRVWNWYLGIYGIYAVCAILAARFWPPNTSRFWKKSLAVMGGLMLFFLLNIEIAHWFSRGHLAFDFTGGLAEALAYTLGWALFGGACMGLGVFYNKTTLSKVGAGVVGLAIVKFFLSDIWQLEALYRIIGLFALAFILIAASFYYQKKRNV